MMTSELGFFARSSRGRAKGLLSHVEGDSENVDYNALSL